MYFLHPQRWRDALESISLTWIWLFSYSGFQINNQWLQGKETNYYEKWTKKSREYEYLVIPYWWFLNMPYFVKMWEIFWHRFILNNFKYYLILLSILFVILFLLLACFFSNFSNIGLQIMVKKRKKNSYHMASLEKKKKEKKKRD